MPDDFDSAEHRSEELPLQTEQLDLAESEPKALIMYEPEEVEGMFNAGDISGDDFDMYLAQKDRMNNPGIRGMDIDNADFLHRKGLLSNEEFDSFLSYTENPVWWTAKDIGKAIYHGIHKSADDVYDVMKASPQVNPLAPFQGEMIPDFLKPEGYKPMIEPFAEDLPYDVEPESSGGKIVSGITEFAVPFVGASKFLKAAKYAPKLMSKMPIITKKFPKVAAFMEFTLADATAGAFADATFDPYEGRAADLMEEWGILPEFLSWMQTNPDNSAALEQFKTVLEGVTIGLAFDGILFGAQVFKKSVWSKHMGEGTKVAKEINNKFGLNMTKQPSVQVEQVGLRPGSVESVYEGVRVNRLSDDVAGIVDVKAPKGTQQALPGQVIVDTKPLPGQPVRAPLTTSSVDSYDTAFRIVAGEGDEGAKATGKVARAIEANAGDAAGSFVEYVYKNTEKIMDKARGGRLKKQPAGHMARKPREKTKAGAEKYTAKIMKDFAKEIGGGRPNNLAEAMLGQMKNFRSATKNMDETVLAFQDTLATYVADVSDIVSKARESGTRADRFAAAEHVKVLSEIQENVYGIRSDIGRTMGAMQEGYQVNRFDFTSTPEFLSDIDKLRGREVDNILDSFHNAKSNAVKMKVSRFTGRNRYMQAIVEYVQANLLWGLSTHAANIVGNGIAIAYEGGIRHFAVTANALSQGDLRKMAELGHFWSGFGEGLKQSFQIKGLGKFFKGGGPKSLKDVQFGRVWKAFATGDPQLDKMVKIEGQFGGGIETFVAKTPGIPRVMGMSAVRIGTLPFTSLTAGDELFKNVGYYTEVNSLIFREADKRVFKANPKTGQSAKEVRKEWIAGVKENIPAEIHYKAIDRGRNLTYQDDLGPAAKYIGKFLSTNPGTAVQLTAIPFYKIAVNLTKFAAARSPLAPLAKKWREDFMAGGIRRYEALGRFGAAIGMTYLANELYDRDILTGRIPPGQEDAWRAAKKLPYAVRINGTYYSIARLEPFAMLFRLTADAAYLKDLSNYNKSVPEHKAENMYTATLLTGSEAIVDATYLKSLSDILQLLTNPDRMNIEKALMRQSEKFVPGSTGWEWYNKTFGSGYIADLNEWADVYMKKINPDEQEHIRHSVYGTKVVREPYFLSTLQTGTPSDPVAVEMLNIQLSMRKPEKKIGDREMTPAQYARFNDLIAKFPIKERLWDVIQSQGYQRIEGNQLKRDLLSDIVRSYRSAAKALLMVKDQSIIDAFVEDTKGDAMNILGRTTENKAVDKLNHQLKIHESHARQDELLNNDFLNLKENK